MKIAEILTALSEDIDPFTAIKAMNYEFKDLAKNFDISLVAGMGWPAINQKGGWFGGGIGDKGGKNARSDSLTIPLEVRRKGFFKELAKKLEGYLEDGRAIEIARGAERSVYKEPAVKGQIFEQLVSNAILNNPPGNTSRTEKMPCVAWFVGLSGDMATKSPMRVLARFYGTPPEGSVYGGESVQFDYAGTIDMAEGRKIATVLNKFRKAHGNWSDYDQKPMVEHRSKPKWHAFLADIAQFAEKVSGKPIPDGYSTKRDTGNSFLFDRKPFPKNTPRLSEDEVAEFIAIVKKHTGTK